MNNYNSSFSKEALKDHAYTLGEYRYKLRLEYITPDRNERNMKWILVIEQVTDERGITIDKVGANKTENSILETLIFNLEGLDKISNSTSFANKVLSEIKELTRKYLIK